MRTLGILLVALALPASAATLTVTTADDVVDAGDAFLSLREAITDATAGDTIEFDFSLDGATIKTTGGTLVIDKEVTIDASPLPAGIRLDAESSHGVITIPAGSALTIEGVSLLNGRINPGNGGGIQTFGNLTMHHCLVRGCNGGFGGGLSAEGNITVIVTNCTFSGNGCRNGGSAVAGNAGPDFFFRHCTIYGNTGFSSGPFGAGAGGWFLGAGTTTTIGHTVFGENRDSNGNLFTGFYANGATTTSEGYNCLDQDGGPGALPTDLVNTDPMLGPLEYWGGKTECHRPLSGSPLLEAGDPAIISIPTRDQIFGLRRVGIIDIGAVESGTGTFEQWAEHHGVLPDPGADDDGDGSTHLEEYIYGTNPDDGTDSFTPAAEFETVPPLARIVTRRDTDQGDTALLFDRSEDLQEWTNSSIVFPTAVLPQGVQPVVSSINGEARRFIRSRLYLGRPQ